MKISIFRVCCALCFLDEGGTLPLLSVCPAARGVPGGTHTSAPCPKAVTICHSQKCLGLGALALCIQMQNQDQPLAAHCASKSNFQVKSLWHYWEKKHLKWLLNPHLGTSSRSGTVSPLHGKVPALLFVFWGDLFFDWWIDLLHTTVCSHWEAIKGAIHQTVTHYHSCNRFSRNVFLKGSVVKLVI